MVSSVGLHGSLGAVAGDGEAGKGKGKGKGVGGGCLNRALSLVWTEYELPMISYGQEALNLLKAWYFQTFCFRCPKG